MGDRDRGSQPEPGAQAVAHHDGSGCDEAGRQRRDGLRLRQHHVGGAGLRQLSAEHPGPHRAGIGRGGEPDDASRRADARRDRANASTACAPCRWLRRHSIQRGSRRRRRGSDFAPPRVARPTPTRARFGGGPGRRPAECSTPARSRAAPERWGCAFRRAGRRCRRRRDRTAIAGRRRPAPERGCPPSARPAGSRRQGSWRAAHPSRSSRRRARRSPRGGRPASGTPPRRACAGRRGAAAEARTAQRARPGPGRWSSPAAGREWGRRACKPAGRTSSNVDRWPAATISLSTPAKVTAAASTNIVVTASQGMGATSEPSVMSTKPLKPRPAYASARAGRLPGKSAMMSKATDPKMAYNGVCEPPPTANPTVAAIGSTTAARIARRNASCSGSFSRIRPAARPHTPAGVSMNADRTGTGAQPSHSVTAG